MSLRTARDVLVIPLACLIYAVSAMTPTGAGEPSNRDALGTQIDDFTLRDFRGKAFRLSDHAEAKAVVIAVLGCECPLAKLYAPRLAELAAEYEPQGVRFVAIDANVQDAVTEMAHYAKVHGIKFPLLKDVGNRLADQLRAERTPEVFLLDAQRIVQYVGRVDDQYEIGIARTEPDERFLADAIDAVIAGAAVDVPWTRSVGCHIGRVRDQQPDAQVTYARQVSRILQKRCVECHREGEIAPFALTTYDEVFGWAEMIDEVVHQNRMPPWSADPDFGKFSNDCRMTDDEKRLIREWMLAGAPLGNETELPPPREFTRGWHIPTPDAVIRMADQPYRVPAEGEVEYQYFVVDPGFTEDKWVRAAECRPGNRAVVHHILVFVQPPGEEQRFRGGTVDSDWLAATAPGAPPMNLPDGYAKFIPAGAKLIFQMHYTPNGSPQTDVSSVGLVFADPDTVKKEVGTWRAINTDFVIPPGEANHVVRAWHTFNRDTLLLALFPHMHLRGKSFRYVARFPSGREETLLWVPRYDFNWQNSYIFASPKRLPAGTRLICTATFDNSSDNPANPDPAQAVRWGDQTWEEMMIGYYSMVLADQDLTQPERRRTDRFLDR